MNNSSATGFPYNHTTTTTTSVTAAQTTSIIRFDCNYFSKIDGQIKLLEIIFSIIALIFIPQAPAVDRIAIMETVCIIVIWWNLILLFVYLCHVHEQFPKIPWFMIETISVILFGALYFLCGMLFITWIFKYPYFLVMLFLAIVLTSLFAYDAYIKFQAVQRLQIAQGQVFSQVTQVNQSGSRY